MIYNLRAWFLYYHLEQQGDDKKYYQLIYHYILHHFFKYLSYISAIIFLMSALEVLYLELFNIVILEDILIPFINIIFYFIFRFFTVNFHYSQDYYTITGKKTSSIVNKKYTRVK